MILWQNLTMRTTSTSSLISLVCLIIMGMPSVLAAGQLMNDTGCDCFLTNGTNQAFYAQHRFYDFRNLQEYRGVADLLKSPYDSSHAPNTSDYFASDDWNSAWNIQTWNNSDQLDPGVVPTLLVNSANNIYIELDGEADKTTMLTMRTARLPGFQSCAEISSVASSYQYLSIRMLAKTTGAPGAVTAIFTYLGAGDLANVQEADLEVRTMDPDNTIQYTNQPSETDDGVTKSQATVNATLPYGLKWTDWAVHRLDWTPMQDTWYVDGQPVATIAYQVPRDPTAVLFNIWSNGGNWSGNMSVNGTAYMNIQWVEMVFNSTDDVSAWTDTPSQPAEREKRDAGCKTVCSIDKEADVGVASELWSAARGKNGLLGGTLSVMLLVLQLASTCILLY